MTWSGRSDSWHKSLSHSPAYLSLSLSLSCANVTILQILRCGIGQKACKFKIMIDISKIILQNFCSKLYFHKQNMRAIFSHSNFFIICTYLILTKFDYLSCAESQRNFFFLWAFYLPLWVSDFSFVDFSFLICKLRVFRTKWGFAQYLAEYRQPIKVVLLLFYFILLLHISTFFSLPFRPFLEYF